ncbi:hypothetical protein BRC87_05985 [Halobacteriales archaeon QS_4_66_20]|nr:MAG: hypothetical protein BRC87_05985 [Halobacteriales archaeon QS_4_66_20]
MHGSNRWFGIGTPSRAALLVVLTVCLAAVGSGMGAAAGAGTTGAVPSAGSHGAMTSTPVGPTTACGPVGGATGTGGASTAPADVANHWVTITSPEASDTFHRGDVVPIDLSFQDNATGTVTVGGEGQPITLDVTVEDADRNGRASVYLNTFQIGNETRDHGAFAVDEGTEIVNVSFQAGEVAPDGPGGDGVVPAGSYDLAAVAGAEPPRTAPESDRHTTTLELADRETGSTTIWTAPRSADHLLDATTVDEIEDSTAFLEAGETEAVTMTVSREDLASNGSETLTVSTGDDTEAAELPLDEVSTVTPTETPTGWDQTATDDDQTATGGDQTAADDDGAGFGMLAAVLALLAAAGLSVRRRR